MNFSFWPFLWSGLSGQLLTRKELPATASGKSHCGNFSNSAPQPHRSVNGPTLLIARQKVGSAMVVDGFAKLQALNFGISGAEISEGFSF